MYKLLESENLRISVWRASEIAEKVFFKIVELSLHLVHVLCHVIDLVSELF